MRGRCVRNPFNWVWTFLKFLGMAVPTNFRSVAMAAISVLSAVMVLGWRQLTTLNWQSLMIFASLLFTVFKYSSVHLGSSFLVPTYFWANEFRRDRILHLYQECERLWLNWFGLVGAEDDAVPPILNGFHLKVHQIEDNQEYTLTWDEELMCHSIQILCKSLSQ